MPSTADRLIETFGVPQLHHQFADRDTDGVLAVCSYYDAGSTTAVDVSGMVGPVRIEAVEDTEVGERLFETRSFKVRVSELSRPRVHGEIIIDSDEDRWTVKAVESSDALFVTYELWRRYTSDRSRSSREG